MRREAEQALGSLKKKSALGVSVIVPVPKRKR